MMAAEKDSEKFQSAFATYNKKKLKKRKMEHSTPVIADNNVKKIVVNFQVDETWDDDDDAPPTESVDNAELFQEPVNKKKRKKSKHLSFDNSDIIVLNDSASTNSVKKPKKKKKKSLDTDHRPNVMNLFVEDIIVNGSGGGDDDDEPPNEGVNCVSRLAAKHLKKKKNKSSKPNKFSDRTEHKPPVITIQDTSSLIAELEHTSDKGKKIKVDRHEDSDIQILGSSQTSSDESSENSESESEHFSDMESSSEAIQKGITENENSISEGYEVFKWLIHPVSPEEFFKNSWEQRPLYLQRKDKPEYYTTILSTAAINRMLVNNNIQYTKNLDVTSYVNGKRETHNPVGRAYPSVVWDYYNNGCSIRLLNPQTYIRKIHIVNATLQEYFGCFVGANAYLTPPDSQGFAPHYDDIEAFILQIEGKKHWKLYAPRTSSEILPRFSSGNFTEEDVGEPIMDVTLSPGDLLYFPRGVIHQGHTVEGCHSLHITLSVYQRNSWGDFLEKLVPAALKIAIEEDVSFRRGLPRGYLNYMGVVHSDKQSPERDRFIDKVKDLVCKLIDHAPIDAAVDQMGKQFIHDALPPVLSEDEKERCVIKGGLEMKNQGKVVNQIEIDMDTKVKLIRAHAVRLVTEEDTIRIYYNVENSLEYHGAEPQYLEIEDSFAPVIEHLINSYPEYVAVSDLPIEYDSQKIRFTLDLWERGLLITEECLDVSVWSAVEEVSF